MSKLFLAVMLVLVLGVGAGPVLAQDASGSGTTVGSVGPGVIVPNPDSSFFGLRWAWMRVSQNIQLWLTRSEEKQAELEAKFAEQEQVLIERIESSNNPERLESILKRMQERHQRRLERLDERIKRIGEKRSETAERLLERLQDLEERRLEASESGELEDDDEVEASEAAVRRFEERREEARERMEQRREELRKRFEERREEIKERVEERREDRDDDGQGDESEVEGTSTDGGGLFGRFFGN